MNDHLSSMITPKNLVKDNLSRVMPLRSKGVVMVDHFIRALTSSLEFGKQRLQCRDTKIEVSGEVLIQSR